MMRQAVPLMRNEAPIVGTGIEAQLARDSRTQIMAEGPGVIEFVDAKTIRIRYDRTEDEEFVAFEDSVKTYNIPKWRKTNQSMTIDLRPICNAGQRVQKGDILTEGYATETVNSPLDATSRWHSCHGRVTTMKMLSCSTSVLYAMTSSPQFT